MAQTDTHTTGHCDPIYDQYGEVLKLRFLGHSVSPYTIPLYRDFHRLDFIVR